MRFAALAVAFVVVLQCFALTVLGGDAPKSLSSVAATKAIEESVGVPVSEFWKDVYEALVRQRGSKAMRKLRFKLAGVFGKNDALDLTYFIMEKLKKEVFDGRVNEEMWKALTMELYFALSGWWKATPENPKEAADLGTWHALVNLYKEILAPALRGSPRIASFNNILLDPDLKIIRTWIEEWKGGPAEAAPLPKKPKAAEAVAASEDAGTE